MKDNIWAVRHKFMKITGIKNSLFGIEMDRALLSDDGTVELVLVQTSPPDIKDIQDNSGRERNVDIFQSLVGGDQPKLDDVLRKGALAILVFPEYAFPSSAFNELDKIIVGSTRPLIVIAGFGGVKKNDFEKHFPDDKDDMKIAWPEEGGPAKEQYLNGGWCWVHTLDEATKRVAFFKCFSEQKLEPRVFENLWESPCNLKISFSDVDLYPLICADIICDKDDSPIKRINSNIANHCDKNRKNLIVGILYQLKLGHELWRSSIASAVKDSSATRLITVNHAVNEWDPSDSERAEWRCQTGIFWKTTAGIEVDNKFAREVRHSPLVGAVMRDITPCVSFGTLDWPPGTGDEGRWNYMPRGQYRIEKNGNEAVVHCTGEAATKSDIELDFMVRRYCGNGEHPTRFAVGKGELLANITNVAPLNIDRFLDLLLNGVMADGNRMKPGSVEKNKDEISCGVDALSFLRFLENTDWSDLGEDGHLKHNAGEVESLILVWNDPKRGRDKMLQELQQWLEADDPHPPLLVFADAKSGEFSKTGKLSKNPRADTTSPPVENEKEDRFFKSKRSRQAYLVRIGELENLYDQEDDKKVHANLSTIVSNNFASMA